MHQDVYVTGISESATCFGMSQVISAGVWCMNCVYGTKYTLMFLLYVYIVA